MDQEIKRISVAVHEAVLAEDNRTRAARTEELVKAVLAARELCDEAASSTRSYISGSHGVSSCLWQPTTGWFVDTISAHVPCPETVELHIYRDDPTGIFITARPCEDELSRRVTKLEADLEYARRDLVARRSAKKRAAPDQ
jgi:hypothetical protein